MIRAFIAVELPAEMRRAIGQAQERLKAQIDRAAGSDIRIQWVKPGSMHLTLKFLGDIADNQVAEIHQVLTTVANERQAFSAAVKGLGAFSDVKAPRVLWIGCTEGVEALQELAAALDAALLTCGFPVESKPYSPHLTLARIKERGREVGRVLTAGHLLEQEAQAGVLPVEAIALMKSERTPSGSVYTKLCEAVLTGHSEGKGT